MRSGSTLPVGRGLWFVCIAAIAWGTGGAAAAVLYDTSGLGPVAVSWWRFVGGVVLLALARRWFGPRTPLRLPRGSWRSIVVTGCGLAVYQTAYYVSIDLAGLAVATVVTLGAGPVLIAVGARLAKIEKLDGAGLAAAAGALVGLALLIGADGGDSGADTGGRLAGVGFALLSAAGYAAVTLITRRGNSLDRYDTAVGGFGVGAVAMAPLALAAGPLPTGAGLPLSLGLLLYLMVVPTALAYALFFAGLAVVRATTASVVALVDPVTAAVVAVTLLGERLTPVAAAGGAILLGTVFLLVHSERTRRRMGVPPVRDGS